MYIKKICKSAKRGSILAYSLIILTMMLAIAMSLSVIAIVEKRDASSTGFSVQALQTADSGAQLAIKSIIKNSDKKISEIFSTCDASSGIAKSNTNAGLGTYDLIFLDADNNPLDCSQASNQVVSIKSSGIYKGTVRAVSVTVAARKYAYVVNQSNNTLTAVNITNPANPVIASSVDTDNRPEGVAVSGNYAYVANVTSSTLEIFDISNPDNMIFKGRRQVGSEANNVVVSGSYAYVSDLFNNDTYVVNISNPLFPSLPTTIPEGSKNFIALNGNNLYIIGGLGKLCVFDISTPSPSIKGNINSGINTYAGAVSGDYVYVVNNSGVLNIFDVSNPASISPKGTINIGDHGGVAVLGNYAYIQKLTAGGFVDVNISDPNSPEPGGSATTGVGRSVVLSGNYAYVLGGSNDIFYVIDISNPAAPFISGSVAIAAGGYAIAINP